MCVADQLRQAGKLWKQLTEEEKKPFEVQAKALRSEYVEHSVELLKLERDYRIL